MNIGNKIKELRKSKGLTQEELAIKCGLSKNGLWNYENNKRQINMDTLNKISTALDVDIEELLSREKIIYSGAMKEIENLIEKYPENETDISETVDNLSSCIFYIYMKKGCNNREMAKSNINYLNKLLSKLRELLERDVVQSPIESPIRYTENSLENISEINNILNRMFLNKLAIYEMDKVLNPKEGE